MNTRALIAALLLSLVLTIPAAAATSLSVELVVQSSAPLVGALGRFGASLSVGRSPRTFIYRLRLAAGADVDRTIAALRATPGVVSAERNAVRHALLTPNDPIVKQQWALGAIRAYEAWDITTGSDLTIAILDTGVSRSHPDLGGKLLPGYNFAYNNGDTSDDQGHGTYTAGVAAASSNNGQGIAGVCWGCKILPVKVLNSDGQGSDAEIAAGIRWAADQGARIISMSLGGNEVTEVLHDAVIYAHQKGALLIAASGNEQSAGNKPSYPAAYPEVLAVAATDGTSVTGFSNTGDYVDIAAPGVGVWSTVWSRSGGDSYEAANGTSAAAPYVSGAAALVLTLRPELTNDQVAALLVATAADRGAPGRDSEFGGGLLDVAKALQTAADPNYRPGAQPQPAAGGSPGRASFDPQPNPNDGSAFFPETGHTIRGAFQDYWQRNGGLSIFGFPVSDEFVERGEDGNDYTVQYFERHRFEFHPENAAPYNVLLSRLGVDTLARGGRDWQVFGRSIPQAGCVYFNQTQQSVCEPFLSYYRTHGLEFDGRPGKTPAESLALFGLPISGPQVETLSDGQQYTVQWFERARFESHNTGVLLGLLSDELVRSRGLR